MIPCVTVLYLDKNYTDHVHMLILAAVIVHCWMLYVFQEGSAHAHNYVTSRMSHVVYIIVFSVAGKLASRQE